MKLRDRVGKEIEVEKIDELHKNGKYAIQNLNFEKMESTLDYYLNLIDKYPRLHC